MCVGAFIFGDIYLATGYVCVLTAVCHRTSPGLGGGCGCHRRYEGGNNNLVELLRSSLAVTVRIGDDIDADGKGDGSLWRKEKRKFMEEQKKHIAPGIRWSSPTQLLVWRLDILCMVTRES